jgi:hypothetical protein
MAKYVPKTKAEPVTAEAFIDAIENPQRQAEARELLAIFGKASGYPARVYTGGMIGFGSYSYETAGCIGTWFATGFAARKGDLSLYGLKGSANETELLPKLGKYREGAGCVYAKRLGDIDKGVLEQLIIQGLDSLKARFSVTAS